MRINSQDFFPGCLRTRTDEDVGNGTPYPVLTADFDTVMNWFRRVRKWQASFIAGLSDGPEAFAPIMENAAELNERYRTCTMTNLVGAQVNAGGFDPTATAQIGLGVAVPDITAACLKDGDEYRPALRIDINTGDTENDGPVCSSIQPLSFDALVNITVDGITITGYVTFGAGGDPAFDMSDVTIIPVEWFAFADADGSNPIIDTSTGSALLEPFAYPPTVGPYA